MIVGIGVDTVDIARFSAWHSFSPNQLRRIFSEAEIAYCCAVPAKSAERFAVRFAAREAFFKALCQAGSTSVPFLALCKAVQVAHDHRTGAPYLLIDWSRLSLPRAMTAFLSLSHANAVAVAMVVVQRAEAELA
jgi:holo-[acyl-carrier protein] synthase